MQPRIRLRNKRGETGGSWLSDKMIGQALRDLADYQEEEPRAGWRVQVCGDLVNWHDYEPPQCGTVTVRDDYDDYDDRDGIPWSGRAM